MAKKVPDSVLDAQLDAAGGSGGNTIAILSGEPADFAAVAGLTLASGAIGAPTKAPGDVSGRKQTWPAVTGISITADGTANHVAITNGANTLYVVTTTPATPLATGGTVDTTAFDHEIGQAT